MPPARKRNKVAQTPDMLIGDLAAAECRKMKEEVIQLMEDQPRLVPKIHSVAMSEDFQKDDACKTSDVSAPYFHPTMIKMERVPQKFINPLLHELAGTININQLHRHVLMRKAFAIELFFFLAALSGQFNWPALAHHRDGLKVLILKRIRSLERWVHIQWPVHGGIFDWSVCGIYVLLPRDSFKKTILKHISGKEAPHLLLALQSTIINVLCKMHVPKFAYNSQTTSHTWLAVHRQQQWSCIFHEIHMV